MKVGVSSSGSDPLRREQSPSTSQHPGSCRPFCQSRDHSVLEPAPPPISWCCCWWVVPTAGRERGAHPGPELRGLGVGLETQAFSNVVGTCVWLSLTSSLLGGTS